MSRSHPPKPRLHKLWPVWPTASLQWRLTLEVGLLTLIGVSGLTGWAALALQRTLIGTHEQTLAYVANRFPQDFSLFSRRMSIQSGLQATLEALSTEQVMIWVRSPNGQILATSDTAQTASATTDKIKAGMDMPLMDMPAKATVIQHGDRYLLACGVPLTLEGKRVGKLFIAQDITDEQRQVHTGIRHLVLGSSIVSLLVTTAMALRIRQVLRSLHNISTIARQLSVNDLDKAPLRLEQAPAEIQGLTEAFNHMLQRLSMAWEHQRQFVSDASHELRTPLTIVYGYLQGVLRRPQNLTPYQLEALDTAASETDRTVRLLQGLLELARADNGYLQLHLESVDVPALAQEVAAMTSKVSQREIQVVNGAAANGLLAHSDRDRLKQVLINLLDNAVKYSEPEATIQLIVDRHLGHVRLQVCDHGRGIALQHQQRIFERFYRVDEARCRTTGGTGLGLAIVKMLVESMGGQITVRSQLGEGSIFTVLLPPG